MRGSGSQQEILLKSWPAERHRWFWAGVPERFVVAAEHGKWFSTLLCHHDSGPIPAAAVLVMMVLFVALVVQWLTGWQQEMLYAV